jgi:hypothetical protein
VIRSISPFPIGPLRVSSGAPSVSGRIPVPVIAAAVQKNIPRFERCYARGVRERPDLAGSVQVRFVIGADGVISNVHTGDSDLAGQGVVDCILGAARFIERASPLAASSPWSFRSRFRQGRLRLDPDVIRNTGSEASEGALSRARISASGSAV